MPVLHCRIWADHLPLEGESPPGCDQQRSTSKAASRAHLRAEALRQEEAAWHQRLARWQGFQATTRRCLEQVEAVGGAALAEQLAEAIRSELALQTEWTGDQAERRTARPALPAR